jgi:hypothetical protein
MRIKAVPRVTHAMIEVLASRDEEDSLTGDHLCLELMGDSERRWETLCVAAVDAPWGCITKRATHISSSKEDMFDVLSSVYGWHADETEGVVFFHWRFQIRASVHGVDVDV